MWFDKGWIVLFRFFLTISVLVLTTESMSILLFFYRCGGTIGAIFWLFENLELAVVLVLLLFIELVC